MSKDVKIIKFPELEVAPGPMPPKRSSLDTLSNQALCKLRDEIGQLLQTCAESLQKELDQLIGRTSGADNERRRGTGKRRTVAPKYRGPHGENWSGRGKKPRWLTIAMSEGKQLEDFLIDAPKENDGHAIARSKTRQAQWFADQVRGAIEMTTEHDPARWTIDYQIDSQNDQWIAVVADSGSCRPTTENFWLALGAAQRAKGIKLTDWKLALEILEDQIERSKNSKRAEERSLRLRMIEGLATKLGPDA